MEFPISPNEALKIAEFKKDHKCTLPLDEFGEIKTRVIRERWKYCFTPTSSGMITQVYCACGKSVDVTEYGKW